MEDMVRKERKGKEVIEEEGNRTESDGVARQRQGREGKGRRK